MADQQNHHVTAAEDALRDSHATEPAEWANSASQRAQAEATLAVAYEQRTANLIAERDNVVRMPEDERGEGWVDAHDKLQGLINERLSL